MHDYSFVRVHSGDNARCAEFCEQMLVKIQEDPRKITWTDESKFTRDEIVNRNNLLYWASNSPKFKHIVIVFRKTDFSIHLKF